MLMTNGIGATLGMLAAGAIVNSFCHYEGDYMIGDWTSTWLIFAAYAAVVMLLFLFIFRSPSKKDEVTVTLDDVRGDEGSGDGFVNDNLPK